MTEVPLDIARDHPAYQGHFPGHPILPAVVLLAEALAALPKKYQVHFDGGNVPGTFSVSSAKFLRPVEPGTPLVLAHEAGPSGERFEIRAPDGVVASGALAARAAG